MQMLRACRSPWPSRYIPLRLACGDTAGRVARTRSWSVSLMARCASALSVRPMAGRVWTRFSRQLVHTIAAWLPAGVSHDRPGSWRAARPGGGPGVRSRRPGRARPLRSTGRASGSSGRRRMRTAKSTSLPRPSIAEFAAIDPQLGNPEISIGGKAAVETNFFAAEEAAALEGRKVEKAEVERFFELVGMGVGQVDAGNMGFAKFHALGRLRVGGRVEQLVDAVPRKPSSRPLLLLFNSFLNYQRIGKL